MNHRTLLGLSFVALLALALPLSAATPKEAVGFWGTVTGVVKSAKADGTSFVITVGTAVPNEKGTVTDGAPMTGKDLTLGTRMPKTNNVAGPHPDDVAYIKTLKAGDKITVQVFATRSDPTALRIMSPGAPASQPAKADGDK